MKAIVILASALGLTACHLADAGQETAQACTARFAGLNNDRFRGWIPTYTFDLTAAKQSVGTEARLQKFVRAGSSVALTVSKGSGPSLMRFEGDAVSNGSQAVARGCGMEGRGAKLVSLELAAANLASPAS